MRIHPIESVGIGEIVDLGRNQTRAIRNLVEPITLGQKKFAQRTSAAALYRVSDVNQDLRTVDPYLNFASLTEVNSFGMLDVSSPFIAKIGNTQVLSITAGSSKSGTTYTANASGIFQANLNAGSSVDIPGSVPWTVIALGSKFFAYPHVPSSNSKTICKTSTDGLSWSEETLQGEYPSAFQVPIAWRNGYNLPGLGFVPNENRGADFFTLGSNVFLIKPTGIHKSSNGTAWSDVTVKIFGVNTLSDFGYFIGQNDTSAFLITSGGYKRTTDSGETWSNVSSPFDEPTAVRFIKNRTSDAKYAAIDTSGKVYISTDTGGSWTLLNLNFVPDSLAYIGDALVAVLRSSSTGVYSSNNGTTLTQIGLPPGFTYAISALVSSTSYFYIVDSQYVLYRSSTGASWSQVGIPNVDPKVYDRALTIDASTELIFSRSATDRLPFIKVNSNGTAFVSARPGEYSSAIWYPAISGNTEALVCNGDGYMSSKILKSDLGSPPYMKFGTEAIATTRTGLYPHIRIG